MSMVELFDFLSTHTLMVTVSGWILLACLITFLGWIAWQRAVIRPAVSFCAHDLDFVPPHDANLRVGTRADVSATAPCRAPPGSCALANLQRTERSRLAPFMPD